MNECTPAAQFGEIDIDSELVASKEYLEGGEDQQIMMLNNGCLCCTVNDDLIRMLEELVSHQHDIYLFACLAHTSSICERCTSS